MILRQAQHTATLKSRIRKALISNKDFRNNDMALCIEIWQNECIEMKRDFFNLQPTELFLLIEHGKLSKHQTILRTRRDLNFKEEDTVGKSYKPTKKRRTKIVKLHDPKRILCSEREFKRIKSILVKQPVQYWRSQTEVWRYKQSVAECRFLAEGGLTH